MSEALRHIADNLRQADLDELTATTSEDPYSLLMAGAAASPDAHLILDRTSLPIGAFGAVPTGVPGVGLVWMVGTPGLHREWVAIARQTAEYVDALHRRFPVLTNFIDARNDDALEWLLRAGFHLIDADPAYGPQRRLFLQFSRTA